MIATHYLYESVADLQYSHKCKYHLCPPSVLLAIQAFKKYFTFSSEWLVRKIQLLNVCLTG